MKVRILPPERGSCGANPTGAVRSPWVCSSTGEHRPCKATDQGSNPCRSTRTSSATKSVGSLLRKLRLGLVPSKHLLFELTWGERRGEIPEGGVRLPGTARIDAKGTGYFWRSWFDSNPGATRES